MSSKKKTDGDVARGKIKNKTPAPVQITAEQLLQDAASRQDSDYVPPKRRIVDEEELNEVKLEKRRKFEDAIRRQRQSFINWLRYAAWEDSQGEVERARSIYERVLDIDYRQLQVWLRYVEMEQKHGFVNRARNVLDRAVTLLPRLDQLWYRYVLMEEQLGNFAGTRVVFDRWMEWAPDAQAWRTYIKFELRHKEVERARQVYEKFVRAHPKIETWVKYAGFEEKQREVARARAVLERALEYLGEEAYDEAFFVAFAAFEERQREIERARAIYRFALDHVPRHLAHELYKRFVAFERQSGDRDAIEDVVFGKRRFQYEESLKQNANDYDTWFDYARLEETYGEPDRVREVYERAIANLPPAQDKRFWRRYIFLWINYAVFEELDAKNVERAREVWRTALQQIPHRQFTFSKIWIMYAHFEVRQRGVAAARQALGQALGMCPKEKLFREYIVLEKNLTEFERVRKLYERWLEWQPASCETWVAYADFESELGELERVRGIYEMAISQPALDMPERVWKGAIDFEIAQGEHDRVRALYRRLLERTKHVKVWISLAQFEWQEAGNAPGARRVYDDAYYGDLKQNKDERAVLAEAWLEFERAAVDAEGEAASNEFVQRVEQLQPRRVKKKRLVKDETGADAGWEEYIDYIFPDEEAAAPSLKILERARLWKLKQEAAAKAKQDA